jgi:hypothetical protein
MLMSDATAKHTMLPLQIRISVYSVKVCQKAKPPLLQIEDGILVALRATNGTD